MDKKAQLKFDADYCLKIEQAITKVGTIFNRIKPKDRNPRTSKYQSLVKMLVDIKTYAYVNTGVNPESDLKTIIKHDQKTLQRVRNAKEYLKTLYRTLVRVLQNETRQQYTSTLDILNRFEDYLEKKVNS